MQKGIFGALKMDISDDEMYLINKYSENYEVVGMYEGKLLPWMENFIQECDMRDEYIKFKENQLEKLCHKNL